MVDLNEAVDIGVQVVGPVAAMLSTVYGCVRIGLWTWNRSVEAHLIADELAKTTTERAVQDLRAARDGYESRIDQLENRVRALQALEDRHASEREQWRRDRTTWAIEKAILEARIGNVEYQQRISVEEDHHD